ncbi:MAG: hypothetical protein AAFO80_18210 [Pseudomonadota bacterium]
MKKSLAVLALATAVATTGATASMAMDMEFNMLTGAIFNELKGRNLPTDNINELSLSQIATIKDIIDGDEPEGQKTNRIQAILERM